jgi:hypothetical protein
MFTERKFISHSPLLTVVLVSAIAIYSANAAEYELISPKLKQAALRHIADDYDLKSTLDLEHYLKGYKDGVEAQLMKHDAALLVDYAGDKSWGRGYEQGIVDARWSNGVFSFADIGYEKYFNGVGEFQFGFEKSSFSTEGSEVLWWVKAMPGISFDKCGKCSVQGWITKKGKYGHMGQYQRTIMVISVEPMGASMEASKPK